MAESDRGFKIRDHDGFTKPVACGEDPSEGAAPDLIIQTDGTPTWYGILLCDADDACAIKHSRLAMRCGRIDRCSGGGFGTTCGLKAFKEYGSGLEGTLPNWTPVFACSVGPTTSPVTPETDPGMYLELNLMNIGFETGDTIEVYVADTFAGPFVLAASYSVPPIDFTPTLTPSYLGKRYYYKVRLLKGGLSNHPTYFSHYAVGMLPDYEQEPSFSGLEVSAGKGLGVVRFYWNADGIDWGWAGKTSTASPTANVYDLEEWGGGYEVQYTDVNVDNVPDFWDHQDTELGYDPPYPPLNPYFIYGHVSSVELAWLFSCFDIAADGEGDPQRLWLRMRGVGYRYWSNPTTYAYGNWTDTVDAATEGHEDDAGWQLDYPMTIKNFTASQGLAGKITLSWDAVTEWPSGSTYQAYVIYFYDETYSCFNMLTYANPPDTSKDITDFASGQHVRFVMQCYSYNENTSEEVYGEITAEADGWEA
jgi:hypothetical protein